MARKLRFFKISKLVNFQIFIFFRLSNTNHTYYCFLLDFNCTLVPAIELVSIWRTLYRMSISISILHFIQHSQQSFRPGNEASQEHIV